MNGVLLNLLPTWGRNRGSLHPALGEQGVSGHRSPEQPVSAGIAIQAVGWVQDKDGSFLSVYYVPGGIQRTLHISAHLFQTAVRWVLWWSALSYRWGN